MRKYDRADAVSQQYIQTESLCLLRSVRLMILQTVSWRSMRVHRAHLAFPSSSAYTHSQHQPKLNEKKILNALVSAMREIRCGKKSGDDDPTVFFCVFPTSNDDTTHRNKKQKKNAYTRTLSVRCIHLLKSVLSNGKFKRVKKLCVPSSFLH